MWSVRVLSRVMAGLLPLMFIGGGCARREPAGREFELRGQILAVRARQIVDDLRRALAR